MKTFTVKAYAGTFPHKAELNFEGFVFTRHPVEGAAWIKYHADESTVARYKDNIRQYGPWTGMVFTVTEEINGGTKDA